ncbi:MAG: response regulator [Planctomycetota bacterium]
MCKPEILIIDDEPLVLRTLKRTLEDAGLSVTTTPCTAEARAMLKRFSYSVILCDQNMPGETGLEFLTEVRRHHPEIRCFMLSGLDVAENWASEIGVERIFAKPCDTKELIGALREPKDPNSLVPIPAQ